MKCIQFTGCAQGTDVVFAIDASGSIGRDNFPQEVALVAAIIAKGFAAGDFNNIGVFTFSERVQVLFDLTTDMMDKLSLLSGWFIGGETNTTAALVAMRTMFSSSMNPKIGVLITDGKNTPNDAWLEAIENRAQGIQMMVIGTNCGFSQWTDEPKRKQPINVGNKTYSSLELFQVLMM